MFEQTGFNLQNEDLVEDSSKDQYSILKRYDFSSQLQRMSSVVKLPTGRLRVFAKGSPEKICDLSQETSLPKDSM